MPTEDLEAYQRHVASFVDEYHPKGATEAHLVQSLADTSWRLNRAAALETNLLNLAAIGDGIQDALAIAASLESQSKALANLSMHTQRLTRQFQSDVTQLRDLQKTRRDQEQRTSITSSTSWICMRTKERPSTSPRWLRFFRR